MSSSLSRRTLLRSIAAGGAAIAAPAALAACSTSSKDRQVSNAGTKLAPWPAYVAAPVPTPELAPSADGVQAGYTRYPDKLVKAVADKPGRGEKIKVITITYGTPPKPASQNKYWAAMNEALGVEIEFTVVPDADFDAKMATVIAGGDLPDIINVGGGHVLPSKEQFVRARCADLTEFLSGDAIKEYPNLANIPTYSWQGLGRIAGRLYGVPIERPKPNEAIFINRTAFDAAGYRPGMSAADFAAVVKEASTSKKFALGSSMSTVYGHKTHAMWHGAPNDWEIKDGKAVDMWGTEEFKATLEYLVARNNDKVFYPDASSTSTVDIKTLFYNGTLLSMADGFAGSLLPAQQGIKGAYELDVLTPYTVSGATPHYQQNTGYFGGTYFKKASKDRIKLLLRVLDWLSSPFGSEEYQLMHFGVEDTHFTRDATGSPILTSLGLIENKINVPFAYLCDAPTVLFVPGDPELTERVHAWEQKVMPMMKPNDSAGLVSETLSKHNATLGQLLKDGTTAIISGRSKLSEWDSIYKKWRDQGGAKAADELVKEFESTH
ncbi:extracellular solute-binding protein [Streptomyces sp. ok210]|uniref:extracellular solute-binding protein n=1 Tax=Streptomyces sp. ok210 TaxID=1761905 RepID=UPI0008EAA535|nr:extracellular solute-binding protein [Streptomyces sp. ok210]SFT25354.1 putative aldouronate transport system substrate-binding protein [Streptomyces sp. ok210]